MVHHWPKELLIWHSTVLSLGQMSQLIMIILSLTALTVFLKIIWQPLLSQFGPSLVPKLIKGKGGESGNKTNLVHASKHIKNSKGTDKLIMLKFIVELSKIDDSIVLMMYIFSLDNSRKHKY